MQAIGPGGGFAEIHRLVGGTVLDTNRRQGDAVERAALEVWRAGGRAQALRLLADGGRAHATQTASDQLRPSPSQSRLNRPASLGIPAGTTGTHARTGRGPAPGSRRS
ncbi:hypothetical protein ACWD0A_00695 [Streptomyces sp. NPDC002867]